MNASSRLSRARVLRWFLASTSGSSAALGVVILFALLWDPEGAQATWGSPGAGMIPVGVLFAVAGLDFGMLQVLRWRPSLYRAVAFLAVGRVFLSIVGLDRVTPHGDSLALAMQLVPLGASVFLGGGWTLLFGAAGAVWLVIRVRPESLAVLLDHVGGATVALVITGVAWFSDYVRTRLEEEAARREADLAVALAAAEQSARARMSFLANMSHEIRTPLNAVLGMLRHMLEGDLPTSHRESADIALDSGTQLTRVLNDVLDIARLEASATQVEATPFSLRECCLDLGRLMRPSATERGLEMVVEVDPEVPTWVCGDAGRLRQVLLNLMGNGVKFSDAGRVSLAVTVAESAVRFAVADTGPGIPEPFLEHLFEPFQQADLTSKRRHGGSGLGLAICQRLVAAMGGNLRVHCPPEGGTVFSFELPLPESEEPSISPHPEQEDGVFRGLRVLVAEDNPVNATVLGHLLTRRGASVGFAVDGAVAVDRVRDEEWDLVLMDCHMPNMDGMEATRAIRKLGSTRCLIPVVAVTAGVFEEERRRMEAAGMDGVVHKPVDPSALAHTVYRLVTATRGPEWDEARRMARAATR